MRTKEAKDFSKSEIKQGGVTDTFQHVISIIDKGMIKNLVSEQKDTEHSVLMMRHTTEQIMTTVEDAHNTADDGETRSENRRDIQGQTRQHSKLINLLEVEQIAFA